MAVPRFRGSSVVSLEQGKLFRCYEKAARETAALSRPVLVSPTRPTRGNKESLMIKEWKKIAFYVRVSRTSQDFPSQLHALKEFCRRHGWNTPKKDLIFAEKITGKVAKRTQLDKLLDACRNGHVDAILCYAVDRMGNSAQHLHNLIATLDALKIRVVGVVDTIDTATSNAATNLFRSMLFAFSQANRERIGERTVAGLNAARARGRVGGKPRSNDEKIAKAEKLRATTKLSLRAIARKVDIDPGYLSRVLSGKRPKK